MKKKRIPAALGVSLVLLCLVLVTAHFTTGMFARFITKSAGNDAGRIASFSVSAASAQSGPVRITPATDKKGAYEITVFNPGKAAVNFTANVVFDDPDDAGKFSVTPLTGVLAPGGDFTGNITLDMNGYAGGGAGDVPFTVVVTFTQID
ncbi:MAG: hypothetical protein IKO92_00405 [Clostridia bacterium]|nr:hypothetical protein [Clostridia bacterium]